MTKRSILSQFFSIRPPRIYHFLPILRNYPGGKFANLQHLFCGRLRLKCYGTRAETRFRLSAKRTNPFKPTGASVLSTTGSRGVHISGNNARNTTFRGSVKGTDYPLHWPVSPSLPLPCVTVCHHISTGVYTGTSLSYL